MPAAAEQRRVPALYWLSGLTCTDENFSQKAGFGPAAAERGVCLVMPDTSPRGAGVEGEADSYDFGTGAGFYVDATESKWAAYQMYTYVTRELPAVVERLFAAQLSPRKGVFGHSMGGHGALTLFLKNPGMYASVSAFAPICHPTACPWGTKAFTGYLGSVEAGKAHDATELVLALDAPLGSCILIDQGTADDFYCGETNQLLPEAFERACASKGVAVRVRYQPGYDHSYYFISSFIADHIHHHADVLAAA